MHQPQRAQGLDQRQLARGEIVEFVVAVHQFGQLAEPLVSLAGEHHPQILYRRAHAAVIQVDQIEGVVAGEDIARVTIAMQADRGEVGAGEDILDPLEQVPRHRLVRRQQAPRHEVAFQQRAQRIMAEVLHAQRFAMLERAVGAYRMHAAQQLAEAIELVEIAGLRCAAAAAREEGEAKAGVLEQRAAVALERCHHRHLVLGQFQTELVLLEDRRVAPATRTIELGDQRRFVFDAHLIDAVLVAVERQHAGIAEVADAFHGVEDQVRRECVEGMGHDRLR